MFLFSLAHSLLLSLCHKNHSDTRAFIVLIALFWSRWLWRWVSKWKWWRDFSNYCVTKIQTPSKKTKFMIFLILKNNIKQLWIMFFHPKIVPIVTQLKVATSILQSKVNDWPTFYHFLCHFRKLKNELLWFLHDHKTRASFTFSRFLFCTKKVGKIIPLRKKSFHPLKIQSRLFISPLFHIFLLAGTWKLSLSWFFFSTLSLFCSHYDGRPHYNNFLIWVDWTTVTM